MEKKTLFADRLTSLMKIKSLSKSDVARICGINKSNITRYCDGSYQAKQDVIYSIALKLNVNPAWLMGYDVPMDGFTQDNDLISFAQHFSEHQKPTDNQQKLIDLASQLPDSELSVLISAAQSLVDLHKSQDAQE